MEWLDWLQSVKSSVAGSAKARGRIKSKRKQVRELGRLSRELIVLHDGHKLRRTNPPLLRNLQASVVENT